MRKRLTVGALLAVPLLIAASCPPKPPEPPKCPETCPSCTSCTDPGQGCVQVPAPGPTCEVDQHHSCWHMPAGSCWVYACPIYNESGGVIGVQDETDPANCPPKPPPSPICPETCPTGTACTDPAKGCVPVEPPPPTQYPVRFPIPDAVLTLNNKVYGQGFDATLIVKGDRALCMFLHGQAVNECHFDSALWTGPAQRAAYEMDVMGGARVGIKGVGPRCQVWQYLADYKVWPCHDDQSALASCDHFGDTVNRDDPKTPTSGDTLATLKGFEGTPKECGLQRDEFGPNAGIFTIAHGKAQVRACLPLNQTVCGPWRPFNH